MLNETIICEEYSPVLTRYPFRQEYTDRFRAGERQAREDNKGLWREERASYHRLATSVKESPIRGDARKSHEQDLPSLFLSWLQPSETRKCGPIRQRERCGAGRLPEGEELSLRLSYPW